jgi:ABC-type transport system involved in cytochrome c biogenesis permease component
MALVEIVVLVLGGILLHARLFDHLALVVGLFGLGTLGYASVGALFALMLGRSRSRDVLLAVILYPIIVPVMIAGSKGTSALLEDTPALADAVFWLRFLVAFDAIFLVLSLWAFEPLLVERA